MNGNIDEVANAEIISELNEKCLLLEQELSKQIQIKQEFKDKVNSQRILISNLEGYVKSLKFFDLEKNRELTAKEVRKRAKNPRDGISAETAAANVALVKNSYSYKLGNMMIMAFAKPGKNTLLLPLTFTKLVFSFFKKK